MKTAATIVLAAGLLILPGCASLENLREDARQREAEASDTARKLRADAEALRNEAEAQPDAADQLREQAERLETLATIYEQGARESGRIADRGLIDWATGAALPFVPPPYREVVALLGALGGAGYSIWRTRRGLNTLAESTVALANDEPQVAQAIQRKAATLRAIQDKAARKAVDRAQAKAKGRA